MYRIFFTVLAAISFIYWGILLAGSGLDVWFNHSWLILAIVLFAASRVKSSKARKIITALFLILCLILGAGTAQLMHAANQEPASDADYCIVLGAKVDPDGSPSLLLYYRLEAAFEYAVSNPDTEIIVTGAKGDNEPVSEAQCMADWLIEKGIDESRIILEEKALNTSENITNSKALLDSASDSIVVVTNRFHVFRAVKLCEKEGLSNVTGLGADSMPVLSPNYYMRELAALFKDLIL